MTQGVKAKRPNAAIRRGLRLISDRLIEDFDNAFDHIFPEASDRDIMNLTEAIDWLEQHASEGQGLLMQRQANRSSPLATAARVLLSIAIYLLAGAIPVLGATVGWWLPLFWS